MAHLLYRPKEDEAETADVVSSDGLVPLFSEPRPSTKVEVGERTLRIVLFPLSPAPRRRSLWTFLDSCSSWGRAWSGEAREGEGGDQREVESALGEVLQSLPSFLPSHLPFSPPKGQTDHPQPLLDRMAPVVQAILDRRVGRKAASHVLLRRVDEMIAVDAG